MIVTKFIKSKSTYDIVLLKIFKINNLFSEINYYYNEIEDIKINYNKEKINTFFFE